MMHYLRHSKLTGISNKTLARIKAESEEVVLAPRKPRSDRMKPSDFDKCEICNNCKTTHKQDNKFYIKIKKDLFGGFKPLSLYYSSKR